MSPRLGFTKFNDNNLKGTTKKELYQLTVDIGLDEIYTLVTRYNAPVELLEFERKFELRNYGNSLVEINGIYLDGYSCNMYGIEINDCDQRFVLDPMEQIILTLKYKPSFSQINIQTSLVIITNKDIFTIPVEAKIPEGFEYDFYLNSDFIGLAKSLIISLFSISGGVLLFIFKITIDYNRHAKFV